MQLSTPRHSLEASNGGSASLGDSFTASDGNANASCTTGVSGGRVGGESSKGASTTGVSAAGASALTMAGSVESSGTDVAASPSEPVTIAGAASSASPAGLKEISPLIVEAPLPGSGSDAAASLREAVAVA